MIRETIARELAIMDGEDWELLGTNEKKLVPFRSQSMYLKRADQLFALREDGCRLAMVKEKRELDIEQVFADTAKLTKSEHKNVLGDKWKFINAIKEAMAHYVREEVDE